MPTPRADARRPVTPATWDAIQQETRHRVLGKREPFDDVLLDLYARYRLGSHKLRALHHLCGVVV